MPSVFEDRGSLRYADVRAWEALISGVGRLEDIAEKAVDGVTARVDTGEKLDMGVGRRGDTTRGGGEGCHSCATPSPRASITLFMIDSRDEQLRNECLRNESFEVRCQNCTSSHAYALTYS